MKALRIEIPREKTVRVFLFGCPVLIADPCCLVLLGVTVFRARLKGEREDVRYFGLPCMAKNSFLHLRLRTEMNRDFDMRKIDADIAEFALGVCRGLNVQTQETDDRSVGYLATQLYETGGHSKLVRDTPLLLGADYRHRLFLTRYWRTLRTAPNLMSQYRKTGDVIGIDSALTAIETGWSFRWVVNKIVREILAFNPKVLLVYIHVDDIVGAAVLSIIKRCSKIRTVYYLHASHYPNVGVSFADLAIYPTPVAASVCKYMRQNPRVFYSRSLLVGKSLRDSHVFTEEEKKRCREALGVHDGALCTMSGAASYKYFDGKQSPYLEMIRKLLERNTELTHVLIASLNAEQQEVLERVFCGSDVRSRLKIVPVTSEYERLFASADVFIDSFPVSSVLAMIDLMRLRVPYVVKINAQNDLYSFHELQRGGYQYMFDTENEMIAGVEQLLSNPLHRQEIADENYEFYRETFDTEPCRHVLKNIIDNADELSRIVMTPPPLSKYNIQLA